jgi:hypothetical protein
MSGKIFFKVKETVFIYDYYLCKKVTGWHGAGTDIFFKLYHVANTYHFHLLHILPWLFYAGVGSGSYTGYLSYN